MYINKLLFASIFQAGIFLGCIFLTGCNPIYTDSPTQADSHAQTIKEDLQTGGNEYGAEFSPDGQTIAFYSNRGESGQARIYLINLDGSDLREIPYPNTGAWDVEPHWSPDGRRIAFSAHGQNEASIYIMNRDGSDLKKVEGLPEGYSMFGAWDGHHNIYFFNWPQGGFEPNVYHINLDGTGLKQLTHNKKSVQPRFGSNNRVYYSKQVAEDRYHYISIDTEGNDERDISQESGYYLSFPKLAADGIYFTKSKGEYAMLLKMDLDGRHATKVADLKADTTSRFDVNAAKTHIVYDIAGPVNMDLHLMDLRSGKVTKLVADE